MPNCVGLQLMAVIWSIRVARNRILLDHYLATIYIHGRANNLSSLCTTASGQSSSNRHATELDSVVCLILLVPKNVLPSNLVIYFSY